MRFYRSDWVGVMLGLVLGGYQPFAILNGPVFPSMNNEALLSIAAFGLIGPPILALISRFVRKSPSAMREKIGKYVNLMFMMIAYGITTGLVGVVCYNIIGFPSWTLVPIAFLGAAGFGFMGAYFINPALADRPDITC